MAQCLDINDSSLLETKNTSSIKDHLQILSHWFSADYKNKIQILYLRLDKKFQEVKDFLLPSYDAYIEEKISLLQGYYPDINLEQLYREAIKPSDMILFNTRVWEINNWVWLGEDCTTVKQKCQDLIRDFLQEKLSDTIESTWDDLIQIL